MLKYVGAIALVAILGACAPQASEPTREELVARGQYLVEGVAGCNDCHTPMTPQGPDMTRALQGAPLPFQATIDIPWATVAPPIAGIPAHFTEAQFVCVLADRRASRWFASASADAAVSLERRRCARCRYIRIHSAARRSDAMRAKRRCQLRSLLLFQA